MKILFISQESFDLLCVRALSWGFDAVALALKKEEYNCLIIGGSKFVNLSQQVMKRFGSNSVNDQIDSFDPILKLYDCALLKCTIDELSRVISETSGFERFDAKSVKDLRWLTKQRL